MRKIGTIAVACSMAALTAYAQSQQDVPGGDQKYCYGGSVTYCTDNGQGGKDCVRVDIEVPCDGYDDPQDPAEPKDPKDDPKEPG